MRLSLKYLLIYLASSLIFFQLVIPITANSEMYKYTDKDGIVHFTDAPLNISEGQSIETMDTAPAKIEIQDSNNSEVTNSEIVTSIINSKDCNRWLTRMSTCYECLTAEQSYQQSKKENDHDRKVGCLKKAICLEPKNAVYYNELGKVILGDPGIFKKAIELDPSFAEPHYYLGCFYGAYDCWKKTSKEAIYHFSRAIELDPNYLKAYEWRARIYQWTGEHEKAEIDVEKTITLDPTKEQEYRAILKMNPGKNESDD